MRQEKLILTDKGRFTPRAARTRSYARAYPWGVLRTDDAPLRTAPRARFPPQVNLPLTLMGD